MAVPSLGIVLSHEGTRKGRIGAVASGLRSVASGGASDVRRLRHVASDTGAVIFRCGTVSSNRGRGIGPARAVRSRRTRAIDPTLAVRSPSKSVAGLAALGRADRRWMMLAARSGSAGSLNGLNGIAAIVGPLIGTSLLARFATQRAHFLMRLRLRQDPRIDERP